VDYCPADASTATESRLGMPEAQVDQSLCQEKEQIPRSKEGFGKSADRDGSIDRFRRFRCDPPSEILLARKEGGKSTANNAGAKEKKSLARARG